MEIRAMRERLPSALNDKFQLPLIQGNEIKWKCRAGARHFEVDGQGLVHLCQPKTGEPAKKLENYTTADIKHYFYEGKSCTKKCPIAYAHLGSRMDFFRRQKKAKHA
jgi:hypothetical protein